METTPLTAAFISPEVIQEISKDITTYSIHTIAIPNITLHIISQTELIHVPNPNFDWTISGNHIMR